MIMCPPDGSQLDYGLKSEKMIQEIIDELLREKDAENKKERKRT